MCALDVRRKVLVVHWGVILQTSVKLVWHLNAVKFEVNLSSCGSLKTLTKVSSQLLKKSGCLMI